MCQGEGQFPKIGRERLVLKARWTRYTSNMIFIDNGMDKRRMRGGCGRKMDDREGEIVGWKAR